MIKSLALFITFSLGGLSVAQCLPAQAQTHAHPDAIHAPNYGSGVSAGALKDSNFNTPESEGRPGVKFFELGASAYKKGEYAHAVAMYKVAASWAYKPAEYDLGLMYFRGQGVPVNRPLGAAWMVLAAERNTPLYVKARDEMVTLLTNAQFAETDKLWGKLKKTYSDKVALRRAKTQWAFVKNSETGSHLGHATGELIMGVPNQAPHAELTVVQTLEQSGTLDGSLAYHQFQQSSNPYSPIFLKHRTGTATVEPLQQLEPRSSAKPSSAKSGTKNT